ncbi:transposase [Actinomadura bangladeshensis]
MGMKVYSEEFKADAVALYLSDPSRTYASVARDLGVSRETLRLWVRQARAGEAGGRQAEGDRPARRSEPGAGPVASDAVLEQENRQLRAKVRELEAERDILRRAAKYFAGETNW